ncbi:unnamed protein product [Adineta ricciae]|uniref:Uncharacterized protein n=1 Tax=Adineta ricciae TaxID=249248 RepID=A0A814K276_ADIRI|nr:unnamed protein product [Adineta ricciae]CAF1281404.1 unnamed protein product [Adineta ricciae]
MAYQPSDDILQCTYDHSTFQNLEEKFAGLDEPQNRNDGLLQDDDPCLPRFLNTQFSINENEEIDNESNDLVAATDTPTDYNSDQLLLGDDMSTVEPYQSISHEVTITTTPCELAPNDPSQTDYTMSELNSNKNGLTLDEMTKSVQTAIDKLQLQDIDRSIGERTMLVLVEPLTNPRIRYKSDGPRQIEKCRTKPIVIQLPDLKKVKLTSGQQFYLRLILLTDNDDPSASVFLHPNKLEYHSSNTTTLNDGTVCVPISVDEINNGVKSLPRLSFIKTKLTDYRRSLATFDLWNTGSNDDEEQTLTVAEAKTFFEQHNLKASRINCQLLIEQNNTFHFTDITCKTKKMEEKKAPVAKKKRPIETDKIDDDEVADSRPSTSKSTKRRKHS